MICVGEIRWIGARLRILHAHPGQSSAFLLWKRLYILHHKQIPKPASKKSRDRHIKHIVILIIPVIPYTTTQKNINIASIRQINQANLFCAAQVYSGVCWRTANLHNMRIGENLGLTNNLIEKSSRKKLINRDMKPI